MHAATELASASAYSQHSLMLADRGGMSTQGWHSHWHTNTSANSAAGWLLDTRVATTMHLFVEFKNVLSALEDTCECT
jgi:hypothetical protein